MGEVITPPRTAAITLVGLVAVTRAAITKIPELLTAMDATSKIEFGVNHFTESNMKQSLAFCSLLLLSAIYAGAQNVTSYIHDLGEALVPYGTITAPNCHKVEIDLNGPWGHYAIPSGINKQDRTQYDWAILNIDIMRIFTDLAKLDEDKVKNQPIFSLRNLADHKPGTEYKPDQPVVVIVAQGLNDEMTLHTVDLDKIKSLEGRNDIRESQMGITMDSRKGAFILFEDQEHADAFEKAIKKAIVVCKAGQ